MLPALCHTRTHPRNGNEPHIRIVVRSLTQPNTPVALVSVVHALGGRHVLCLCGDVLPFFFLTSRYSYLGAFDVHSAPSIDPWPWL